METRFFFLFLLLVLQRSARPPLNYKVAARSSVSSRTSWKFVAVASLDRDFVSIYRRAITGEEVVGVVGGGWTKAIKNVGQKEEIRLVNQSGDDVSGWCWCCCRPSDDLFASITPPKGVCLYTYIAARSPRRARTVN